MQLNNPAGTIGLRASLMAATCALLSPAARPAAPEVTAAKAEDTTIDAGLLYYKEDKGRVQSIDAIVKLTHDFGDERTLSATVAVDSLTGGSPNGAIASNSVQTFATPSGTSATPGGGGGGGEEEDDEERFYTIAPGAQPLFPDFHDLRVAADINWSQPLGIGNKMSVGAHLSKEYDFLSASANAAFSRDFNSKNTTLSLGISAEFDQIDPVGGTPVPGSNYNLLSKTSGNESKKVLGGQLGLTQVLARNWIAQLNFSLDRSSGYLNDPYKLLTRVDATGAVTGYQFEDRPDSHTRRSVYLGNKVALGRSVLDLSWRYGTDNWSIHSNTAEARFRIPLGASLHLEPHLRWYKQDAAEFYRLYLTSVDSTSDPMSADPRLGAFTAKTIGVKLSKDLSNGDEISMRLEAYQQDPKVNSSTLPALAGLDLNPRLRALMLQFGWRFGL